MSSLPACCGAPEEYWPWARRLPGLTFVALNFTPVVVTEAQFRDCGIEPPPSVRRAVAKRQSEYLAGRLCARTALQRVTGQARVPGCGEDRAPCWPDGCVGSISHGEGRAAAVVGRRSDYAGVGLDLEPVIPAPRARTLVPQILTDGEQRRFARDLDAHPGPTLTRVFSLKESLFKALYPLTLTRFYFEHAEVLEWQPDGGARLRLLTDLSEDWRYGRELEAWVAPEQDRLLTLVAVPVQSVAVHV
jgi:enterobactin synthetase component D